MICAPPTGTVLHQKPKKKKDKKEIVRFGQLRRVISLTVLKRSTKERFSHPYKKCFVLLSSRYEISYCPFSSKGSKEGSVLHNGKGHFPLRQRNYHQAALKASYQSS